MELELLNLLVVLLVAWLAGNAASKIGYPSVLGELLAGIILGPPLLGLMHGSEAIYVLAEVGVLLMMLYVGMEIQPKELKEASWGGVLVAVGGFITPFVLAYYAVIYFGGPPLAGIFVGVAAGVTSLATKSRILVDLQLFDTRIAHVMMAGALLADTISLILFAGILSVAEIGTLAFGEIALVTLKAALFFVVTGFVGLKVFPYVGRKMAEAGYTGRTFNFTFILLVAVLFGELAHLAGLHAILGAFIAGLFLQENVLGRSMSHDLMELVHDASVGFLAPLFFVTAGFEVTFGMFSTDLALFITILVVATVGKIGGTALFYLPTGHGWREGLTIGAGMNGRGAVEIIVAAIGLEMGLISAEIFSILVFMAIFTTATVPFLLKLGVDWLRSRGELHETGDQRTGVLLVGANPVALSIAEVLSQTDDVRVVDSNEQRCRQAEAAGLTAIRGDALDERTLSEAGASSVRTIIAATSNPEVNALVTRTAGELFQIPERVVLQQTGPEDTQEQALDHLQASVLFGQSISPADWQYWLSHDWVSQSTVTAEEFEAMKDGDRPKLTNGAGDDVLPLAIKRDDRHFVYHSEATVQPEDDVILLVARQEAT